MNTNIPEVSVHCRCCWQEFSLPADHEDVAHPFPGPICSWCEQFEDEEFAQGEEDDFGEDDVCGNIEMEDW